MQPGDVRKAQVAELVIKLLCQLAVFFKHVSVILG